MRVGVRAAGYPKLGIPKLRIRVPLIVIRDSFSENKFKNIKLISYRRSYDTEKDHQLPLEKTGVAGSLSCIWHPFNLISGFRGSGFIQSLAELGPKVLGA